MVGLLGRMFSDDQGAMQMQGGLLGPMTAQQKMALTFAGLRDAVGGFSGRPTQNLNSLAEQFAQQGYRQQLRQDRLDDRADTKAYREQQRKDQMRVPLSPQEVAAAGYRPGTVAYKDGLGVIHIGQQSDMKSAGAIDQEVDLMNRNPQLDISRANLGLQRQRLNFEQSQPISAQPGTIFLDPRTRQPIGQMPLSPKDQAALADRQKQQEGAIEGYDAAINTLDKLDKLPGFSAAVGMGGEKFVRGVLPFMDAKDVTPGTQRADFVATLETLKSQTFLPMVQALKGMGQLSNAEGEKLTAAIGALDTNMSETAFKASVADIRARLEAARVRNGGAPRQQSATPQAAPTAGAPKPFDVVDGYRFKGGDPANKNNWVKVN